MGLANRAKSLWRASGVAEGLERMRPAQCDHCGDSPLLIGTPVISTPSPWGASPVGGVASVRP